MSDEKKKANLDLYTNYFLNTFGTVTATGLSTMVEDDINHDKIISILSEEEYTSKDLWIQVKSTVRMIEHENVVLIVYDTIQEKAWTDKSQLMCWHYDQTLLNK